MGVGGRGDREREREGERERTCAKGEREGSSLTIDSRPVDIRSLALPGFTSKLQRNVATISPCLTASQLCCWKGDQSGFSVGFTQWL